MASLPTDKTNKNIPLSIKFKLDHISVPHQNTVGLLGMCMIYVCVSEVGYQLFIAPHTHNSSHYKSANTNTIHSVNYCQSFFCFFVAANGEEKLELCNYVTDLCRLIKEMQLEFLITRFLLNFIFIF